MKYRRFKHIFIGGPVLTHALAEGKRSEMLGTVAQKVGFRCVSLVGFNRPDRFAWWIDNHLDAVVLPKSFVEAVAVVSAIADQSFREVGDESPLDGGFDKFRFMRRSAGHVHGERKTMAVADRHDFAAFTAPSRADGRAPFLAELNVASMNASLRSSLPRSRKSSASFSSTRSSSPDRCHC
jgi:hypothetical protein